MDLFGTKILVVLVFTILIVFSGAVPPAYKQVLDTWYGRIGALFTVLIITNVAGWPFGVLATIAVLTLMPVGVREGFVGGGIFQEAINATCVMAPRSAEGFVGGGVFREATNATCVMPGDNNVEGFTGGMFREATNATCVMPGDNNVEGFEGDKLQVVPAERRQRWFIERVMRENPLEIETNNVDTLPTQ